jgi:hypothetical protein
MTKAEKYFKQQLPQLKGISYRLSKKFKKEYKDIEGEVFLRFSEVIKKYDEDKSSIYTYLKHQMKNVKSKIIRDTFIKNINTVDYNDKILYDKNKRYNNFKKVLMFYDAAATELTNKSKEILNYILESPISSTNRKPTYNSVMKYFVKMKGWSKSLVKRCWDEIKHWWLNNRYEFV